MGSLLDQERAAIEKAKYTVTTMRWDDGLLSTSSAPVMPWQTEAPRHTVTINAFAVSKFEITRAQYAQFVADGRGDKARTKMEVKGCNVITDGGKVQPKYAASWEAPGFPQTNDDPVVCVSWEDAQDYVEWLSAKSGKRYRLLTEAEWEYVARAGTETPYWWPGGRNEHCAFANGADETARATFKDWTVEKHSSSTCTDGQVFTTKVGSYQANPWGLYDIGGNAAEWTEDCFQESYSGAPTDGSAVGGGPRCSARINRGGSWADEPYRLSSSYRGYQGGSRRLSWIGFLVAREL